MLIYLNHHHPNLLYPSFEFRDLQIMFRRAYGLRKMEENRTMVNAKCSTNLINLFNMTCKLYISDGSGILVGGGGGGQHFECIRTTPHHNNSPPNRYWPGADWDKNLSVAFVCDRPSRTTIVIIFEGARGPSAWNG